MKRSSIEDDVGTLNLLGRFHKKFILTDFVVESPIFQKQTNNRTGRFRFPLNKTRKSS